MLRGTHGLFPSGAPETVAELLKSPRWLDNVAEWDEALSKAPMPCTEFLWVGEFDISEDEKKKVPESHWWCFI